MAYNVFEKPFSTIYPLYVEKVTKKGRTTDELDSVIVWLTGYTLEELPHKIKEKTLAQFLQEAPMNPNAQLITGVVCGVRVENIVDSLTQKMRYLDKVVDELAKGKKLEKIMRS
ncbi:DUF2200 domain-containing protein [Enterococcus timonensis]|uniref:DUF2200 domain-containing protein n=1 Tax=Enterococcus timonensis TaxID=1852364 RepID=UPI0008D92B92|nr:DUF2200 family protein [Enterococcus timonensis]